MKRFNKFMFLAFTLTVLVASPYLNASAMEMKDSMMDKLTNTNVPVTIPLTKGYVKGSEVFYISTESSDKDLADHLTKFTGFRVAYTPALQKTPADALAQIYAFKNGIEGTGPLGFQPNVADSQPGDINYSPLWAVNIVEWKEGITSRELKSQTEILDAQTNDELTVTVSGLIVNCPFVQWDGGSLQIRDDKILTDSTPYGGGQVLDIDTENMQVTFVAHRGFGPDGSTIYYIATDASKQDVADMLGVLFVEKTGATLVSSASSDLYVFTNGIEGSGPMGFQASIGSTNVGGEFYSPLWRIQAVTWKDPSSADFLITSSEIASAGSKGALTAEIAGVVVNCPFVEVDEKFMMEDKMMKEGAMMEGMTELYGMSSDGTVKVEIEASTPTAGEAMTINVEFTDAATGNVIEHINYDITATQVGTIVLEPMSAHEHMGDVSHATAALSSGDPVDVTITIRGIGLPGEEANWTGPMGDVVMFTVVPEFGTIAVMILGIAIVSIIAMTTRSKIIPRI